MVIIEAGVRQASLTDASIGGHTGETVDGTLVAFIACEHLIGAVA